MFHVEHLCEVAHMFAGICAVITLVSATGPVGPQSGGPGAPALRRPGLLCLPVIDGQLVEVNVRPTGGAGVAIDLEVCDHCRTPSEGIAGEDREVEVLFDAVEPHGVVGNPARVVM